MQSGIVKWFNDQKGYGFITPDGSRVDVFVHHSKINMTGYRKLVEGDKVSFEVEESPKGPQAVNVVVG